MFEPQYQISPTLLDRIKRIAILVHELNKRNLSDVVLAQLQAEAQVVSTFASTSIEGNPLPITEVRQLLKTQPDQLRQSEQEVLNYNKILAELSAQPDIHLTKELLLHIHRNVTQELLPDHQLGHLRREPVVIHNPQTKEVVYLPPDHEDVGKLVDDLMSFVQANQQLLDPLILAGLFHKQMVIIHPFVDGNGRATRLATKVLLSGLGLNLFNLFSFENYYNQNVTRYFQNVGLFGNYYDLTATLNFTPWLEYFADGILDELLRVAKEIEKRQATPATTLKAHHRQIMAYLDEHGFITDREYAKLTERAKATRTLDFNYLIKLGLIVRKGKSRSIYYQRA
ncbi:MAG: Fic family protein [Chloroflexi bacterium]|nr:Fic family protein [Chloroflexota bacterium]